MTERFNETAFSNLHPIDSKFESKATDKTKLANSQSRNHKIVGSVTINNQKKKTTLPL